MKNTGFAQGLYATSSTQKECLGLLRVEPDGRKFRYAKSAGTLVAGKMCIMSVAIANHVNISMAVAASIGDTAVQIALGATAATADQYKDGYLIINDGTGEGHCYGIDTNAAAALSTTCQVTLKDPVQIALVTSGTSEVSLIPNPFNGVTHSATEESGASGVAMTAVTSGDYCWVQSGGVACPLGSGSDGLGSVLSLDGTAGAVAVQANYTMNKIGTVFALASASGEYRPVWLTID